MKTGIELIALERLRQIEAEGWTPEHDAMHDKGELAEAAAYYAITPGQRAWLDNSELFISANNGLGTSMWPWRPEWFKPSPNDRVKELTKAGALIAAEIDRLQNNKQ